MSTSIWSTIECNAWSRDFDYDNYLNIHSLTGCVSKPLSKKAYDILKRALYTEMIDDMLASHEFVKDENNASATN